MSEKDKQKQADRKHCAYCNRTITQGTVAIRNITNKTRTHYCSHCAYVINIVR